MKKDRTKTHGFFFALLFTLILSFIAFSYIKWLIKDREIEKERGQIQEMVDYHRAQGYEILVNE